MSEALKTMADVAKKTYGGVAQKLLQLFGGLFMEMKDEDGDGKAVWVVSMTRMITWIVFGHCMFVWSRAVMAAAPTAADVATATKAMLDVAPQEFYTLCALLGLSGLKIVGSKAADVVAALKDNAGGGAA
jgi:hypothetical protein